jgi:hypothetical protein
VRNYTRSRSSLKAWQTESVRRSTSKICPAHQLYLPSSSDFVICLIGSFGSADDSAEKSGACINSTFAGHSGGLSRHLPCAVSESADMQAALQRRELTNVSGQIGDPQKRVLGTNRTPFFPFLDEPSFKAPRRPCSHLSGPSRCKRQCRHLWPSCQCPSSRGTGEPERVPLRCDSSFVLYPCSVVCVMAGAGFQQRE